jgi:hypothetical protein
VHIRQYPVTIVAAMLALTACTAAPTPPPTATHVVESTRPPASPPPPTPMPTLAAPIFPSPTLPYFATPTPRPTRAVCASPAEYTQQADYAGSFTLSLVGASGRTGVISDTRIVIRSAPVPGSNGAIQFAFWFQGRGGSAEQPLVVQLRLLATAGCLLRGSGAGRASVLPAPHPGDFLVPPKPFGQSSQAALSTDDPYDFRLYAAPAGGGAVAPEQLPVVHGFVTGGEVQFYQYGPGLVAWHADGVLTATIAVSTGEEVPAFSGAFDAIRP